MSSPAAERMSLNRSSCWQFPLSSSVFRLQKCPGIAIVRWRLIKKQPCWWCVSDCLYCPHQFVFLRLFFPDTGSLLVKDVSKYVQGGQRSSHIKPESGKLVGAEHFEQEVAFEIRTCPDVFQLGICVFTGIQPFIQILDIAQL